MLRSDYHTLVNMGRKAGLRTSELYSALAGRRPNPHEAAVPDGNGVRLDFAHGRQAAHNEKTGTES